MTNFPLYLIHLWWQFFQMFIYGNVVYAQTWPVLTLKNCMEPLSSASMAYVVAWDGPSFFSTVFCKNLGNLQEFFGLMDLKYQGVLEEDGRMLFFLAYTSL